MEKRLKRILVFKFGFIGDSLMALPALWALRNKFPEAEIAYCSEFYPGREYVKPKDIYQGTGLIDHFFLLNANRLAFRRPWHLLQNLWPICSLKWDLGIILESAQVPMTQRYLRRLKWLIRLCGPTRILSPRGPIPLRKTSDGFLAPADHEADAILKLLTPLGIPYPGSGNGRFRLPVGQAEKWAVDNWLKERKIPVAGNQLVAVSAWSNFPSTRWPIERYGQVIKRLLTEFDIVPVLVGGRNEQSIADELVGKWGTGLSCMGMPARFAAELLRRCIFYLGNDTGPLHLAAAVGTRCVGVFSSRNPPGNWYPYGKGHIVFRTKIACEGCLLSQCNEKQMECIKSISVETVLSACEKILLEFDGN
jgi:heptosyltransferase-3